MAILSTKQQNLQMKYYEILCWKKSVSSKIILREKFIQETNALKLSENIAVFYLH